MAKKSSGDPAAPKKLSTYTIKLDDAQMKKLRAACEAKSWEPMEVAYTRFAFKGPDCNVSAYTSGKVVVAGKGTEDFVQNTIEQWKTQGEVNDVPDISLPFFYERQS